jgi:hypothetical protein
MGFQYDSSPNVALCISILELYSSSETAAEAGIGLALDMSRRLALAPEGIDAPLITPGMQRLVAYAQEKFQLAGREDRFDSLCIFAYVCLYRCSCVWMLLSTCAYLGICACFVFVCVLWVSTCKFSISILPYCLYHSPFIAHDWQCELLYCSIQADRADPCTRAPSPGPHRFG